MENPNELVKDLKLPAEDAPIVEWALYYADMGIPVFPIRPQTKDKYYKDTKHLGRPTKDYPKGTPFSWSAQATTDKEQLKITFTKYPNANIGGVTGNGFYALDVDIRENGNGFDFISKWEKEKKIPGKVNFDTWTSITGSGSRQYFYYLAPNYVKGAKDMGVKLSGNAEMVEKDSHVDTRGNGRYVVLPPSTHPNGNRYKWDSNKNPSNSPIAEFDDTILFLFVNKGKKKTGGSSKAKIALADGEKVQKGGRYDYVVSTVGMLVNKMMDFATDDTIVAAAMQIAHRDLDDSIPLDSGWDGLERNIERMVYTFRNQTEIEREELKNTDWKYNMRAWREEHSGEKVPDPVPWDEVKAAGDRKREKEKSNTNVETTEIISQEEQEISELNLDNWFVDDTGVYRVSDEKKQIFACYAPVYPVERLQNTENGQEKITLKFKRDNRWREITVDKTVVANNRKVVDLAAYGLPITSNIAKRFVDYCALVENLNNIPIKTSANHFGWVDGEFIPYSQNIIFDADGETNNIEKSLIPKGDLNGYIKFVQKIRRETKERFEVRLVMAASLASVLIKPLNMLPFILNIWGNTGTGKTVDLKLAASIWADPTEGKFITDSDSTKVALAIRAGLLRNLPVMIDDFSKANKRKEELSDIIYSLSSGKEKDRGSKDSKLRFNRTWQNCSITTNESPLTTPDMRGGALNRVLDYEMCEGDIFEDPAEVLSFINENHGVLGEAFIELINEIGISKIKDIRKDFENKLLQINNTRDIENKQLQPLSVILTADYIATKFIFKDNLLLNPTELSKQLKSKDDISDGLRAYRDICDYVMANAARFAFNEVDLADPDKKIERWGIQRDGFIHFFPLSFRSFMEQNGHDITVFCKWAKEKNHKVLKTLSGNMNSISINGKTHRVYSIEINKIFDFEEPDDSEEIPYD